MGDLDQNATSTYNVPLAPAAATLPEGLRAALRLYAEGKTGWMILIGTIYA